MTVTEVAVEVTLAGNAEDYTSDPAKMAALEQSFRDQFCGTAACTVVVNFLPGSVVADVKVTTIVDDGANVVSAVTAFHDAPPADIGGVAVESVAQPSVMRKEQVVLTWPPPPSTPATSAVPTDAPTATLSISLVHGWTWLSLNNVPDDLLVGTIFSGVSSLAAGDHLKDQFTFTDFYDGFGF